jgi:Protein of unknown function (DUF3489)
MTKLASRKSVTREDRPIKLTDTQFALLSRAAQRHDGAAAILEVKNEKAAHKLAATLIEQRLVREVREKPSMPVWRHDEERRVLALIITKHGRAKIDVPAEGRSEDAGSKVDEQSSTGKPTSLPQESAPRRGIKLAEVISLRGRKRGAGIGELILATGWLPHTTRAALTGLRKRGFAIERSRNEQGTLYRIVTANSSDLAA